MDNEKVVLVTGGASGIGWATVQEFSKAGWAVVIGDINITEAEAKRTGLSGNVTTVALDVRYQDSIDAAMRHIAEKFGRLDALINNAGVQQWTSLANLDWDAWNWVLDVNLNGVARCLTGAYPLLQKSKGAVVNIVSISAERGVALRSPYTASKAAVIGLTKSAAIEWAPQGIRVNAVGPGYVATELMEGFVASGQIQAEQIMERIPMARFAEPREIAKVIKFLASEDASYVTGHVLFADGGFLANSNLPGNFVE
jgi:3-oxoacyl-[acyl-carrier protein] reductase